MKEEEGSRYLSPLVKQDLAKLNSDGDTRSIALKSLKLFEEQLDVSSLFACSFPQVTRRNSSPLSMHPCSP